MVLLICRPEPIMSSVGVEYSKTTTAARGMLRDAPPASLLHWHACRQGDVREHW